MPENTSPTRSLRLGVAGPVGTGKSSLIALLCRELSADLSLGVITNDIYTDEDARFLRSAGVLDPDRIRAVETGACPHTAIRDDVTANLLAVEDLEEDFAPLDVVLVESGGDNLTATFSPALVDAQIFVLDVAGGGDVARKGGPGIARADLLVVNKTDLAPYVGVDVERMVADGEAAREGRPVLALSRENPASVAELCGWVRGVLAEHTGGRLVPADPGPMAPHFHADEDGGGFFHSHEDDDDATAGTSGTSGAADASGASEVAGTSPGRAFVHRHDGAGAHRHADGAHPVEHVHHETYLGEELAPTAGGPGGLRGAARG
ncbi:urease accessory protein [Georgenia muralis]|uniref:Urease accessory protein UreG n=1 Tax=Georgenia muralis TaxID=154117 RepID=A0A3N4YZ73_9MICO|nr:urease accessory protein [Georgenia muralis]